MGTSYHNQNIYQASQFNGQVAPNYNNTVPSYPTNTSSPLKTPYNQASVPNNNKNNNNNFEQSSYPSSNSYNQATSNNNNPGNPTDFNIFNSPFRSPSNNSLSDFAKTDISINEIGECDRYTFDYYTNNNHHGSKICNNKSHNPMNGNSNQSQIVERPSQNSLDFLQISNESTKSGKL